MIKKGWIAGLILATGLMAGCSNIGQDPWEVETAEEGRGMIAAAHDSASVLETQLEKRDRQGDRILQADFVAIENLTRTTRFGQMISQQVATGLTQAGHDVIEVRLRRSLAITPDGEFILSRDIKELAQQYEASAVLTGVYAVGSQDVVVNARLIDPNDSRVLAAADFGVPRGPNTRTLLDSWREYESALAQRSHVVVVASDRFDISDGRAATGVAGKLCARRGQVQSLVDRILEWGRATSYYRCAEPNAFELPYRGEMTTPDDTMFREGDQGKQGEAAGQP